MHKTANVLNKLHKEAQPKAKSTLQAVWMAETRADAERAFDAFNTAYRNKYPKAVSCLIKNRAELLTFYNFPGARWLSIRTTSPIESRFATVRLRAAESQGCVSPDTTRG